MGQNVTTRNACRRLGAGSVWKRFRVCFGFRVYGLGFAGLKGLMAVLEFWVQKDLANKRRQGE